MSTQTLRQRLAEPRALLAPGIYDALTALTLAYCVLPCLLKLAAMALLYLTWIRPAERLA